MSYEDILDYKALTTEFKSSVYPVDKKLYRVLKEFTQLLDSLDKPEIIVPPEWNATPIPAPKVLKVLYSKAEDTYYFITLDGSKHRTYGLTGITETPDRDTFMSFEVDVTELAQNSYGCRPIHPLVSITRPDPFTAVYTCGDTVLQIPLVPSEEFSRDPRDIPTVSFTSPIKYLIV